MDKKRKRAFHRMLTGLQIAQNCGAFMRFMTLTTAKEKKRALMDSFRVLKLRIERATYEKDGFLGFKFNRYFSIRTSEGNGVLHIVFWGRYIPQAWLSKTWREIHGAFRADIRACSTRKRRVGGLVGYLLTNYLTEQPIERMSYGWKWAWVGFCNSWKVVREHYSLMRRFKIPEKVKRGENDIHGYESAHMHFADNSWEAWWSFLWGDRATSRQLKMKGSKHQKWWKDGFNREELDLEKYQPAAVVYGLPKQKLVWCGQSTLFGFKGGF